MSCLFSLIGKSFGFLLWLVVCVVCSCSPCRAKFNNEAVERISEHLDRFMGRPKEFLDMQLAFRHNGGVFPADMGPADRDTYFSMVFSLPGQPNTFFALEDGTFMGIAAGGAYAFYKENGDTTYEAPTSPNDPMWKYWTSCVDRKTGAPENCTLDTVNNKQYNVECIDGCTLDKCPDPASQRDCSSLSTTTSSSSDDDEAAECRENITFCPQYRIVSLADQEQNITRGYIPRTYHCINQKGRVTENNCFFENGTPVQRNITADYAYCQGKDDGGPCNPLVGNYRTRMYDARYRDWYTKIRERQKPLWSKPEPSFDSYEISYSTPMYRTDDSGRRVFDGVMAMDYDLSDITQYLKRAFFDTDIAVAIFEQEEPHYLIASSTGSLPVFNALVESPSEPCPYDEMTAEGARLCEPFRLPMTRLGGHPTDRILVQAFHELKDAGFPRRELLTLNLDDDLGNRFFVSTVAVYDSPDTNLSWSFIVVMPGSSSHDSLSPGQPDFALICGVACFGAVICLSFLVLFVRNRKDKTIMFADWRFTCVCFLGCATLNMVSLTFLGKNTDTTCLVRMWSFHLVFVVAISPLLAKCLRMRLLVSNQGTIATRRTVTHFQTLLIMLVPILLQVVILLIFTFVDPPTVGQVLENPGMVDVTQHVMCTQNTEAFRIIQIVYEGGLVLVGAVLAYQMRHVESKYGEAKQLIFSMSSILGVGAIILIFSSLMEHEDTGKKVLYAVGVCWGTVICCCAFALPRLLSVQQNSSSRAANSDRRRSSMTERGNNFSLRQEHSCAT